MLKSSKTERSSMIKVITSFKSCILTNETLIWIFETAKTKYYGKNEVIISDNSANVVPRSEIYKFELSNQYFFRMLFTVALLLGRVGYKYFLYHCRSSENKSNAFVK